MSGELLTPAQAADALRVSRATAYRLIAAGELDAVTVDGTTRVPREALARYLNPTKEQTTMSTASEAAARARGHVDGKHTAAAELEEILKRDRLSRDFASRRPSLIETAVGRLGHEFRDALGGQDAVARVNSLLPLPNISVSDALTKDETVALLRGQRFMAADPAVTFPNRSYEPGIVDRVAAIPVRPTRLLDLMRIVPVDVHVVPYPQETTRTDNAAETAEGTAAPEGAYAYTREEATAIPFAEYVRVFRGALGDQQQLTAFLEGRLDSAIRRRAESQAISGDGTGKNWQGLSGVAGVGAINRDNTASEPIFEALLRGIEWVADNYGDLPTAVAIHPLDDQALLLEKDSNGNYLVSGAERAAGTVHGVKRVVTAAVPQHTAVAGSWYDGAAIFVAGGLRLALSESDNVNFVSQMVTVQATFDAAFAPLVPSAFCDIDIA